MSKMHLALVDQSLEKQDQHISSNYAIDKKLRQLQNSFKSFGEGWIKKT